MSARKLPFVVQPRSLSVEKTIGNEESGQIKILAKGYVSVGEKAMVQQSTQDFTASMSLVRLLEEIAATANKTTQQVLTDLDKPKKPKYLEPWEQAIVATLSAVSTENVKREMIQATAILISRVDPEWTAEDTMKLHPALVSQLSDFYNDEDLGVNLELNEEAENTGAEGKA